MPSNKHLLDETESNIQFIASRQGNIGGSEARKLVLLEYCKQPIFCGIDAVTDNYYSLIDLNSLTGTTDAM